MKIFLNLQAEQDFEFSATSHLLPPILQITSAFSNLSIVRRKNALKRGDELEIDSNFRSVIGQELDTFALLLILQKSKITVLSNSNYSKSKASPITEHLTNGSHILC